MRNNIANPQKQSYKQEHSTEDESYWYQIIDGNYIREQIEKIFKQQKNGDKNKSNTQDNKEFIGIVKFKNGKLYVQGDKEKIISHFKQKGISKEILIKKFQEIKEIAKADIVELEIHSVEMCFKANGSSFDFQKSQLSKDL
jgi:fibronectin type 3 domain-containing protein